MRPGYCLGDNMPSVCVEGAESRKGENDMCLITAVPPPVWQNLFKQGFLERHRPPIRMAISELLVISSYPVRIFPWRSPVASHRASTILAGATNANPEFYVITGPPLLSIKYTSWSLKWLVVWGVPEKKNKDNEPYRWKNWKGRRRIDAKNEIESRSGRAGAILAFFFPGRVTNITEQNQSINHVQNRTNIVATYVVFYLKNSKFVAKNVRILISTSLGHSIISDCVRNEIAHLQ